MHKFYFILHIILGTAAVAGTFWGVKSFQETWNTVKEIKGKNIVEVSARDLETTSSNQRNRNNGKSFSHKNILWEDFLFSPKRNEGVEITESSSSEQDQSKIDMELVGIGSLGTRSAAIIFVKTKDRNKEGNNRNVYLKGAQVEDTGYKVDEITLDEVTLVRASREEKRVLRIHRQDDASQKRSKEAVQHAAKARQAREKEDAKEDEKDEEPAPKSPSSPSASGGEEEGGGHPAPSEMETQESEEQAERLKEREERLKKLREVIKERREEIQKAREE